MKDAMAGILKHSKHFIFDIRYITFENNAEISNENQEEIIKTIDTMIKHRLVMSRIPAEMYNFKIKSGTVQFHVKDEFLLLLTLSGDDITKDTWKCLDLKLLIKDPKNPDKPHLDQYLASLAKSRGKKIYGLETFDQSLIHRKKLNALVCCY